jgi:hypothetical protein
MSSARAQRAFDRWSPHSGSTFAYLLFRRDLTELNTFCWHGHGVVNHAQKLLAHLPFNAEVKTALDYGKDPGRRSDSLVQDVRGDFKDVANWIRLARVVFTASILELFVRRIVTLALRSDPGLLISQPRIVDGVALLKNRNEPDVRERVQNCTEGTWSAREHGIHQVFGVRVAAVFDSLKELQALQDTRNSIAHDFARKAKMKDFWYIDPEQANPQSVTRISVERLQQLLRTVGAVAAEIERSAIGHVGSFELFLFWQKFLDERTKPKTVVIKRYLALYNEGGFAKLLSTYNHNISGEPLGRIYCRDLLTHYGTV